MYANIVPHYPANGNLMLYNMFPYRAYQSPHIGMEDMISYVRDVGALGFNAIWINPLQLPGNKYQLHPNNTDVNGSLYAMADDRNFNPLIFPNCSSVEECEEQLKKWTAAVRLEGMYPLFDLVLNHIGQNEDSVTPLQKRMSGLLLSEVNPRWPDIQGLDYYKNGTSKRGITTESAYLDEDKINDIVSRLWEPMIRRYILDYGFMGVRVDAITHIPVPVQQKIFKLIRELVKEKYDREAIIVGELMVGQPEPLVPYLKACDFTHCLHPSSYFWSPELEGGYMPDTSSSFLKQTQAISPIVVPGKRLISEFSQLFIHKGSFDKRQKQAAHSMHLFYEKGEWLLALNDNVVDICLGSAFVVPIRHLSENSSIIELLETLEKSEAKEQRKAKAYIFSILQGSPSLQNLYFQYQSRKNSGSLLAVSGNHDVGTLLSKVMLDLAYKYAMEKCNSEKDVASINLQYRQFKNIIKGVPSPGVLLDQLAEAFHLNEEDCRQIRLQLQARVREKLFVQALICSGYVMLAGDELGVCHKPDVFSQFGENRLKVGPSLVELSRFPNSSPYDLRAFIRGLNQLLSALPEQTCSDRNTPYTAQINLGDYQITFSAVVHTSVESNTNYLLVHCSEDIPLDVLEPQILKIISSSTERKFWKVQILNQDGSLTQCEVLGTTLISPFVMGEKFNSQPTETNEASNNASPTFFREFNGSSSREPEIKIVGNQMN